MAATKEQLEATLKFIDEHFDFIYEYTKDSVIDEVLEPNEKELNKKFNDVTEYMNTYMLAHPELIDKTGDDLCGESEMLGFKRGFLTAILLRDVIL